MALTLSPVSRCRSGFLAALVFLATVVAPAAAARADLLARFDFDSGAPVDATGNGFDGEANGGAASGADGSGVQGSGRSFGFNGAGRIAVPMDVNPTTYPDLTVAMWVRADPALLERPGLYKVFGHDDGGWDRCFGVDNRNGGFRWAAFTGGAAPGPTQAVPNQPLTSEWTFLAAVWDTDEASGDATIRLHVNGDFIEEPLFNTPGQTTLSIGSLRPDGGGEGWIGQIDEVEIWNEALTPARIAEIRAQVTGEVPGPEPVAPRFEILAGAMKYDGELWQIKILRAVLLTPSLRPEPSLVSSLRIRVADVEYFAPETRVREKLKLDRRTGALRSIQIKDEDKSSVKLDLAKGTLQVSARDFHIAAESVDVTVEFGGLVARVTARVELVGNAQSKAVVHPAVGEVWAK